MLPAITHCTTIVMPRAQNRKEALPPDAVQAVWTSPPMRSGHMKKLLACLVFVFLLQYVQAQRCVIIDTIYDQWVLSDSTKAVRLALEERLNRADYTVSGKLKDETGQPLTGAVISDAVGKTLAATDAYGRFSFRLPGRPATAYTIIRAAAAGKQQVVRSIHISAFPAMLDLVLIPTPVCCNGISKGKLVIREKCCDIDISWPVDKLFTESGVVVPKRKNGKRPKR